MREADRSRRYYDAFSDVYEAERHRPYHRLLDDLEVELALAHGGDRVLEAGCGTGLILGRLAAAGREATGVDLSAGMLARARARGLRVVQGSIDRLPFRDRAFDGVVCFKVLAHVPAIREALAEMARVTRPGGHLVVEFYNRRSLRYLVKRLKPATRVGGRYTDEDVYTRYDTVADVRRYLPPGVELIRVRGVRVLTPLARALEVPLVGGALARAERAAADAPVTRGLGGFLIAVLRRR